MIKVIHDTNDFLDLRKTISTASVGAVPTMGNLHEGHLSLLKRSIAENDMSVITIFVNPKQFGPHEDFQKYPRTLDEDLSKIASVAIASNKEVIVFAPKSNEDIYPPGFNTTISVKGVSEGLEGLVRPTHFDGVTTVVYRLFKIILPQRAYFGQKDFQQCAVIKQMVRDLDLNIDIIVMPIIRNAEGLALSSRNQYLSAAEREEALLLPQTLREIAGLIEKKSNFLEVIAQKKIDPRWDYLDVLDAETLKMITPVTNQVVVIGALRLKSTRLIDNIVVNIL